MKQVVKHRTAANISLIITTLFVIGIYAFYFFTICTRDLTLTDSLGLLAVTILLILLCKKHEEVFAEFLSDNAVEFFLVVKLLSYIITYKVILSFLSFHWAWWILSAFAGIVTIVIEIYGPAFRPGK